MEGVPDPALQAQAERPSGRSPDDTRLVWIIAACGLLALLIRFYYVNAVVIEHPNSGDAGSYYAYAWNLLHHGVFSKVYPGTGMPVPDSYRDPGYPLLVASVMWAKQGGDWYHALLGLQAFLGGGTVVLALFLARGWMRWPWLIAAGILMAVWPHSVSVASYVLTETLVAFLLLLALVATSMIHGRLGRAILAGVVFGMAGLTNAVLLPAGAVVGLCLALRGRLSTRLALGLLIGSLLLPGAWMVRNMSLHGRGGGTAAASSSGRAIQNLVQGSWPAYHQAWQRAQAGDLEAAVVMAQIDHEITVTAADHGEGIGLMVHRMSADPLRYLLWYAGKPLLLWGWDIQMGAGDVFVYPVAESPYRSNAGFRLSASLAHALNSALLVCAAVFCVVILIRPRAAGNDAGMLACATVLVYVTAVYWLLQSEPRYSIAFRPLQVLAAMTWLGWAWAWAWTRRHAGHRASGA